MLCIVELQRKKQLLLSKKNIAIAPVVDKPEGDWKNVLSMDKTKIELFDWNDKRDVWR